MENPEAEFNKTALNTCRSTIAQQEVELKRLKEVAAIRNKRILQLEELVGHASESIDSRDNSSGSAEISPHTILSRLEQLEIKLAKLQPSQACNNIVINSCQPSSYLKQNNVSTQTEPPCCNCDDVAKASADTAEHESNVHDKNQAPPDNGNIPAVPNGGL